MLTLAVFLPLLGTLIVLLLPAKHVGHNNIIRTVALAASGITLLLFILIWLLYEPGQGYQFVNRIAWIPSLNVGYAVGVDGISLPRGRENTMPCCCLPCSAPWYWSALPTSWKFCWAYC